MNRAAFGFEGLDHLLDNITACTAFLFRFVSAWDGCRFFREGMRLLVARVDQAVVGRREDHLVVVVGVFEFDAAALKELEMVEAIFAVELDLFGICRRPRRALHVREHILERVIEARRLLDARAAPEIDRAFGERRRSAAACRAFEDERRGAGALRFDRGGTARDTEADNHDIVFAPPGLN